MEACYHSAGITIIPHPNQASFSFSVRPDEEAVASRSSSIARYLLRASSAHAQLDTWGPIKARHPRVVKQDLTIHMVHLEDDKCRKVGMDVHLEYRPIRHTYRIRRGLAFDIHSGNELACRREDLVVMSSVRHGVHSLSMGDLQPMGSGIEGATVTSERPDVDRFVVSSRQET